MRSLVTAPILVLGIALAGASHAQNTRSIPLEFEGVKLGALLPTESPEKWGLDAVSSADGSLGVGVQVWIKPKKENPELEYRELPPVEKDSAPKTSHRLFLVPVLTAGAENQDGPVSKPFKQMRIDMIEWSDDRGTKNDHYRWAYGMCRALKEAFSAKPLIVDNRESELYSCEFVQGNRKFQASSLVGRRVSLSYTQAYTQIELNRIDKYFNRQRAQRVLQSPN